MRLKEVPFHRNALCKLEKQSRNSLEKLQRFVFEIRSLAPTKLHNSLCKCLNPSAHCAVAKLFQDLMSYCDDQWNISHNSKRRNCIKSVFREDTSRHAADSFRMKVIAVKETGSQPPIAYIDRLLFRMLIQVYVIYFEIIA